MVAWLISLGILADKAGNIFHIHTGYRGIGLKKLIYFGGKSLFASVEPG